MKKLLFKLSLLLPIIIIVFGINYWIDPASLFRDDLHQVGDMILKGYNVTNSSNYDERQLQKYYIERITEIKDIVVLGSSRAMQIGHELFPNTKFFNSSVSGATIEDLLAIYSMYEVNKKLPKLIILGVDPWIFNKNNNSFGWKSIKGDYINFFKNHELPIPIIKEDKEFFYIKLLQLFEFNYFQASLSKINLILKGKSFDCCGTKESELDQSILMADGTRKVSREERLKTEEQVTKDAYSLLNNPAIYQMENYQELDNIKIFESFIQVLKSKGIKIVIFLAPYNPILYNFLISAPSYKIIGDVEKYLLQVSFRENIPLLGSFNPFRLGFTQKDFYDGMHPRRESIIKLFQQK